MEFIQHSTNWLKGETFEAAAYGLFGVVLIIGAVVLWKYEVTANAKALVLPILLVGILFSASGLIAGNNHNKHIAEYKKAYSVNPAEFIAKEKERVEGFMYLDPLMIGISTLLFVVAMAMLWQANSPSLLGIEIGMIVFIGAVQVIDYFSKERAFNYYEIVLNELGTSSSQ